MSTLYLVATPIGNREDMSPRGSRILSEVDIVYAEDTRHSRQLLFAFGIEAELRSLHQHNEKVRVTEVIDLLDAGKNIALVSDAGMPLISDPGSLLVASIQKSEHSVVPIPGPSAVIAAVAGSGLSTQPFSFFGFLPDKKGKRENYISSLTNLAHTLVFFVAIHDLQKYLKEIEGIFPIQTLCVARELTKLHEQFYSGTASELSEMIESRQLVLKGEAVLLIDNTQAESGDSESINKSEIIKAFANELPSSKLAKIIAKLTGENRQDVYAEIEELKK
ncbi:MAG: 16S rRNA (cytidine(1402)-2'-O)-methyltransferase [Gammaproteobacteria bacterium]|nr:16S rRNA (cytidine(1402)-2'-O)-methyltransferase [Gammaproteobacteria bacterium]NNC97320.1 16S rRNA (cytidine(1402)-2'-O)-methyltransferase [Gammaproteobacteria bacterium]NNM14656.1 16S rRNA (cytidine(1402)-2'-O)-methyltransferase [Gammaproteobacteria bacterium]